MSPASAFFSSSAVDLLDSASAAASARKPVAMSWTYPTERLANDAIGE
jgi:hypothetical protein